MKTLKFGKDLIPKILSEEKTTTWRLFDDKDLQVGDKLVLIEKKSGKEFARATITEIRLSEIEEAAWQGKYEKKEDMYDEFKKYYGLAVTPKSILKIIVFSLEK